MGCDVCDRGCDVCERLVMYVTWVVMCDRGCDICDRGCDICDMGCYVCDMGCDVCDRCCDICDMGCDVCDRGSVEATRMAYAMINGLVQDADNDLSDIIARVKGWPVARSQSTTLTGGVGGECSLETLSNPAVLSSSCAQKMFRIDKTIAVRQALTPPTLTARTNGPAASVNAWHVSPANASSSQMSPRRSPQKQIPVSLFPATVVKSSQDLCSGRPSHGEEMSNPTSLTVNGCDVNCDASNRNCCVSELRPLFTFASAGVCVASKSFDRPPAVSPSPFSLTRCERQPLPIVSKMRPASSSMCIVDDAVNSADGFSAFQLWNDSSPIVARRDDFATVAAAGLLQCMSSDVGAEASSSTSPAKNDPAKAPGYNKARCHLSSSQNPPQEPNRSAVFAVGRADEQAFRSVAALGGMVPFPHYFADSSRADVPGPLPKRCLFAGDGHGGRFASQVPKVSVVSSSRDMSYSKQQEPMTLPEIKSTLNPNAPDFQIAGIAGIRPEVFINGYACSGGDMKEGEVSSCHGDADVNAVGDVYSGYPLQQQQQQRNILLAMAYLQSCGESPNGINNVQKLAYLLQQQQMMSQTMPTSPAPGCGLAASCPSPGARLLSVPVRCDGLPAGCHGQAVHASSCATLLAGMHRPSCLSSQTACSPKGRVTGSHRPNSAPSLPGKFPCL